MEHFFMAFVFYDTETTGTETAFDQILQFAAIKTDDNLFELESINLRSRILPHIVPAPGALVTTRVHPSTLVDAKLQSHYSLIREVRAKLSSWSPATFVGYNSIAFDEELLRQALFQTLHSPYLTNTKGNKRADVMRMAHAACVYSPGTLVIPTDVKGKETFRLAMLAPANGYEHKDAHDALADVRATIHIARLIKERSPDIWDAMLENSSKQVAVDKINSEPEFSWTERYGTKNFSWIVTACGVNPNNSGQIAVFDLGHNPDEYIGLGTDEIITLLGAKTKVIRSIRANAQPIIMPASMSPDTAAALAVPQTERQRRSAVIESNLDFQDRVSEALSLRFADEPAKMHVEQLIYDGFANADEPAMDKFHFIEWAERHSMASQFQDARIKEFGSRLLFFEHPDGMGDEDREARHAWVRNRLTTEEEVPWMTIAKAMVEADKWLKDADAEATKLINDTKDFLSDMLRKHKAA